MSERDELLVRWELGITDAADEAALAEALRDPAARRAFVRNARIAVALGAPATVSAPPPSEKVFAGGTTKQRKVFRLRSARPAISPQIAVAASVVLVAGLVALLVITQQRPVSAEAKPVAHHVEAAAPTAFAHLVDDTGSHIVAGDGRRRSAHSDEALVPGDTIETTANAATVVLGRDVARLELVAGSSLSLPVGVNDPLSTALKLGLGKGHVTAEVATRRAGAPFLITTPLASVEVVGTRFTFGIDENEAHLSVAHGAVRLSTPMDAGVLVNAGRSALVSEGLVSLSPPSPDVDQPLPAGSRVLWRITTDETNGWRGVVDTTVAGGAAWRSVAPRDNDPWSRAELRSPVTKAGWAVEPNTWLRFRYHVEHFAPRLALSVHLKPSDESNFDQRIPTDTSDGWHQALLRVDGAFRHLGPEHQPLAIGEVIHGAVWCAMRDDEAEAPAARFWIRDVVVFTGP